jgi:hypothetical protein
MKAPTTNFLKGNRLVFHDGIVIAPEGNKKNQLRAAGKLPKLTRYILHPDELPAKARRKVVSGEQYKRRKDLHERIEKLAEHWPDASAEPWEEHVLGPLLQEIKSLSDAFRREYNGQHLTLHGTVLEYLQALGDVAKQNRYAWMQSEVAKGVHMARGYAAAAKEKGAVPIQIEDSDVAGFGMTAISFYQKKDGKHSHFSIMSIQSKHLGVFLILCESAKQHPRLSKHLYTESGSFRPIMILRSDNSPEQQLSKIEVQLALWFFFLYLDLDYLQKEGTCPGRSKTNPAEMYNRTVKDNLGGICWPSGNGEESDF